MTRFRALRDRFVLKLYLYCFKFRQNIDFIFVLGLLKKVMEERQAVHKEVLKQWNEYGGTRGLGSR